MIIKLLLIPLLLFPLATSAITTSNSPSNPIIIDKIGSASFSLISSNCYKGTLIVNITNTTPLPKQISIQNFNIIVTTRNQLIANVTNTQSFFPNNNVTTVNLYPNISVGIKLSFFNVCVTTLQSVNLIYFDGNVYFTWSLP